MISGHLQEVNSVQVVEASQEIPTSFRQYSSQSWDVAKTAETLSTCTVHHLLGETGLAYFSLGIYQCGMALSGIKWRYQ
jgi:phage terminase large subunit-like protein